MTNGMKIIVKPCEKFVAVSFSDIFLFDQLVKFKKSLRIVDSHSDPEKKANKEHCDIFARTDDKLPLSIVCSFGAIFHAGYGLSVG